MVKVSEKNRYLASYLEQNQCEFMIEHKDSFGDLYKEIDVNKLAEIIQEFYDELC